MKPTFAGEMQLAGWSDTHTGGCKVTFWLQSQEDLDVFKALTTRKGNTAGHRFMAALVEIGEDEQPVQPQEAPKGGPLAKEAAMLCAREDFQAWLLCDTEEEAAADMRDYLGIATRAELDSNKEAAWQFIERYRIPFMKAMRERQAA